MKSFSEYMYLKEANVYGQPWENSFRKAWQDAGKFTSKSFNSLGVKGQEWTTLIDGKYFKGKITCRRMGNPLSSVASGEEMYYEMISVAGEDGQNIIQPRTYYIAHDKENEKVFSNFFQAIKNAENKADVAKALYKLTLVKGRTNTHKLDDKDMKALAKLAKSMSKK